MGVEGLLEQNELIRQCVMWSQVSRDLGPHLLYSESHDAGRRLEMSPGSEHLGGVSVSSRLLLYASVLHLHECIFSPAFLSLRLVPSKALLRFQLEINK